MVWHRKLHVTEIMWKSTARRSRRASTRRVTSYIHTTYFAPTFLPSPSPCAQLLSRVSLQLALARKDRPIAATSRASCSWNITEPRSPMRLTEAADASWARERDVVAQRCIGHPTDGMREHWQCTDCSLAPKWRRRLICELQHNGAAHTHPAFYSFAYCRAACASVQELLVALPCLYSLLALPSALPSLPHAAFADDDGAALPGFPCDVREWERDLSRERGPGWGLSPFCKSLRFSLPRVCARSCRESRNSNSTRAIVSARAEV